MSDYAFVTWIFWGLVSQNLLLPYSDFAEGLCQPRGSVMPEPPNPADVKSRNRSRGNPADVAQSARACVGTAVWREWPHRTELCSEALRELEITFHYKKNEWGRAVMWRQRNTGFQSKYVILSSPTWP